MPSEPPHDEMSRRGKIGIYRRLVTADRREMTRPARDAKRAKLEREIDPHHELPEEELNRRVQYAMKAWSAEMHRRRWGKQRSTP